MRFVLALIAFFGIAVAHDDYRNYTGDAVIQAKYKISPNGDIELSILDDTGRNPVDLETIEFKVIDPQFESTRSYKIKLTPVTQKKSVFKGNIIITGGNWSLVLHIHNKTGVFNGDESINFNQNWLSGQFDLKIKNPESDDFNFYMSIFIGGPTAIGIGLVIFFMSFPDGFRKRNRKENNENENW